MIICVEGPDCGGKTTLIEHFKADWLAWHAARGLSTEVQVVHKGPPDLDADPFTEYETALDDFWDAALSTRDLVLLDRWHAGELVYGPMLRGKSRLTTAGLTHVDLSLRALSATTIICLPPVQELTRRFKARGDDLISIKGIDRLRTWYQWYALQYDHVTYAGNELKAIDDELVELMRADARRVIDVQGFSNRTYLGHPEPAVLLVGDERNVAGARPRHDLRRPFTPVHHADCSTWLWDAVYAAGLHEFVGCVNVNEPGIDLSSLYQALDRPHVVALGNRACAGLDQLGIDHQRVPHPQWWKRFKHRDFTGYVNQLKEAIVLAADQGRDGVGSVPDPA